jgi:tRNA 2-thiouridine synthesizing protein E
MPTTTLAGYHDLALDAEGFLQKPEQWTDEVAREIAQENGIAELTDKHWQVVKFMRNQFLATGTAPTIRTLGKESGVAIKELYQLFPKGPAKLAAKIGGIPKPHGCI